MPIVYINGAWTHDWTGELTREIASKPEKPPEQKTMQIDDPPPEYNAYCEGVLHGMEKGIELLIAGDMHRNQYAFYANDDDELCWTKHFRGELEAKGVGIESLVDDLKRNVL